MKRMLALFRRLLESLIFVVGAFTILEYGWAHWPKPMGVGTGLVLFIILALWFLQHFCLPLFAGLRASTREPIGSKSQPDDAPGPHSPTAQGDEGR